MLLTEHVPTRETFTQQLRFCSPVRPFRWTPQESPTAVVGNHCHELSLSNSIGSDGDGETCSQESEPTPPGRSSFGDAGEPTPAWEIDPSSLRCSVCFTS